MNAWPIFFYHQWCLLSVLQGLWYMDVHTALSASWKIWRLWSVQTQRHWPLSREKTCLPSSMTMLILLAGRWKSSLLVLYHKICSRGKGNKLCHLIIMVLCWPLAFFYSVSKIITVVLVSTISHIFVTCNVNVTWLVTCHTINVFVINTREVVFVFMSKLFQCII